MIPGTELSHYKILEKLGRGGMGEVYLAFDEKLRRRVAIKTIRASYRFDRQSLRRFKREARILSRLDHPNICRAYDYIEGEFSDHLVLELIEGETLADEIEKGIDVARGLQIAQDIGEALVAAHAEGIVHRDLKPGNIMLTPDGQTKVLDFGLSRALDPSETEEEEHGALHAAGLEQTDHPLQTRPDQTLGTLPYMSPEQAAGRTGTQASDVYAFGLILHELFTGKPAFDSHCAFPELLLRVQAGAPPVEGLSAPLAALIESLKEPTPSRRPTALQAVRWVKKLRDRPRMIRRRLLAAAVLLSFVLLALMYVVNLRKARKNAQNARDRSEGLFNFVMEDLHHKLDEVGRLDILDDAVDAAMEYLDQSPEDDVLQRARVLFRIGQIRKDQGDLNAALSSMTQSHELLLGNSEDLDWLFERSQAEFGIGQMHYEQGDLQEADRWFHTYLDSVSDLSRRDPENPTWRQEMAYAQTNIGALRAKEGEATDAVLWFQQAVDTWQGIVKSNPADADARLELADALSWLGSALEGDGDLAQSLACFEAQLTILEELEWANPEDHELRFVRAICLNHMGSLLRQTGEPEAARERVSVAVALLEKLVRSDRTNTGWARDLAVNEMRSAHLHLTAGELERSEMIGRRGLERLQVLVQRDRSNDDWLQLRAEAEIVLGRTLFAREDWRAARELAEAALRHTEDLAEGAVDAHRIAAQAHLLLGRLHAAGGDRSAALESWSAGLARIEQVASDSRDPSLLDPWARTLMLLGRGEEANEVLARLAAAGYRDGSFVALCRELRTSY